MRRDTAYILLASGYDSVWLNEFIGFARLGGYSYQYIGLTSGAVKSRQGTLQPTSYTLSKLNGRIPSLLILPAGDTALSHIFVDPHVHGLIKSIVRAGGRIGVSSHAEMYLRRAKIASQDAFQLGRIILQRLKSVEIFAQDVFKI